MQIERPGYRFAFETTACETCPGHCCTGDTGDIFATPKEIRAIARHLGLSLSAFKRRYTRRAGRRLSLTEKAWRDGEQACVFYDGSCRIYEVRPKQCQTFPFWSRYRSGNLEELVADCPGVKP